MNLPNNFFDDILGESEGHSLGSPSPKSCCIIEITMNYPRTTAFCNSSSSLQKKIYERLISAVKHSMGPLCWDKFIYTFEFCKSGHIHCHAQMQCNFDTKHYPIGVVADIVKAYLKFMPKRYSNYNDKLLYVELRRYRSPCLVVQYVDSTDIGRIKKWQDYIRKDE